MNDGRCQIKYFSLFFTAALVRAKIYHRGHQNRLKPLYFHIMTDVCCIFSNIDENMVDFDVFSPILMKIWWIL